MPLSPLDKIFIIYKMNQFSNRFRLPAQFTPSPPDSLRLSQPMMSEFVLNQITTIENRVYLQCLYQCSGQFSTPAV